MKRISIIFAAICSLIACGFAFAQSYPPNKILTMFATDLFRDISQGNWPVAIAQYVTAANLQSWIFSSNLGHAGVPVLTTTTTVCGGSTAAIVGTDWAGTITTGGSASTSCVMTFSLAYNAVPTCTVSSQAGEAGVASFAYATTATHITITQTSEASNVWNYVCVAQAGG